MGKTQEKEKVLRQLTLEKIVDERLERIRANYKTDFNLNLTVQDVIRKMILDHEDYKKIA